MRKQTLMVVVALSWIVLSPCPDLHAQYVIDSLNGDVTQREVDTFITTISGVTIPTSEWSYNGNNTLHNYLADGTGGQELRAMNRLYRITRDNPSLSSEQMQLMNLAITWTEAWLAHRNDLPAGDGRVMWTGKVDAIWPPDAPTVTCPGYAASEVGDTVGHMAETAYNIVSTPAIWNQTVPDGNPNGYGVTYLDRAKTYESMLEFTMDEYFNANFLNSTTAFIQHPSSSAYTTLACNGNVNAWNRGMMFLHAYQILGQIHELLGDNPSKASLYKQVTVNWVNLFVQNAQPLTAPDGTAVYDWGYGNFGDESGHLTQESTGHAQYDMWGLTYAWRAGYYSSITRQNMNTYADTLVHETMISPGVWASFIDRCCNTNTTNYLFPGHLFLTPFNSSLYQLGANADLSSGRQPGSTDITMSILWAKHWNYTHALPAGFSDADIGNPMLVGDGSFAYGTFKIKAGGSGILGGSDQFNYLSESWSGDGTLVARVASQQNMAGGAKAGVMFRASGSANDAFVAVYLTPSNGAVMQYRNAAGASAAQAGNTAGPVTPYWVKLVRSGSTFTGYTSPDGANWTQLGQVSVSMAAPVLAGLAVTSNVAASLNTSTFDNVSFTAPAPTTTSLVSSMNPSLILQSVTFTATVTTSVGTPTGNVTFFDGVTQLGAPVALNASGVASLSTSALSAGVHSMTAVYAGDAIHAGSTSNVVQQQVTSKNLSNTALVTSKSPAVIGTDTTVTFTATVTGAVGTPTGTVNFFDFGASLGAVSLTAGVASLTVNLPPSVTSPLLAQGAHSIVAVYSGDSLYAGSTSSPVDEIVKSATQTNTAATLASDFPSPVASFRIYAQPIVFTATIAPGAGSTTGETVTLYDGTTSLGTATLNASGIATFSFRPNTTPTLQRGLHALSAVYQGDTNFAASISPVIVLQRTIKPR